MVPTSPMYPERRQRLREAIARANTVGEKAIIWSYGVTHARLVLLVECLDGEPLHLDLIDVREARFRPRWAPISLEFSDHEEGLVVLADQAGGFWVRCSVILVNVQEAVDEPGL